MNTRRQISEPSLPVALSVAFNRDASCFAVGHDAGFCVFNTASCELDITRDLNGGIGKVEMLERSGYIILIGGGRHPRFRQNTLNIWDEKKRKVAVSFELRTSILGAKLSRSHIVAALQNSIHIYDFANPPKKRYVFETTDNHSGLCCLGEKIVVFPGNTPGNVQLVELVTGNISIIPAHSTPLRVLELSSSGELLATASERGTLIRIFSTRNNTRIAELRRGVDTAIIFSIKISPNNKMLAATSDKSTLHLFDIPSAEGAYSLATSSEPETPAPSKWSFLSKLPFLPRAFSDTYSFTSAAFNSDDDPDATIDSNTANPPEPIPGIPGGRASKGMIGWLDDTTIVVVGAGRSGTWQKFSLSVAEDGIRVCQHLEWQRYLGGDHVAPSQ